MKNHWWRCLTAAQTDFGATCEEVGTWIRAKVSQKDRWTNESILISGKKVAIESLYTNPSAHSVVIRIDELGPMSARTRHGQQLIHFHPLGALPAERAKMELDDGRRPTEGFVFGALQPHTGECFTQTYKRCNIATFVDILDQIEAKLDQQAERIYILLDNLHSHAAYNVLLFNLAHPRWEFMFQPDSVRLIFRNAGGGKAD